MLAQLAFVHHANANGGLIAHAPMIVDVCSERRPELTGRLREAYADFSRRLTPEERIIRDEFDKASDKDKQKVYADLRAMLAKLSEEEVAEQCAVMVDHLRSHSSR